MESLGPEITETCPAIPGKQDEGKTDLAARKKSLSGRATDSNNTLSLCFL